MATPTTVKKRAESKNTAVYLPAGLKHLAILTAENEHRSRNKLICLALEEYIERSPFGRTPLGKGLLAEYQGKKK